MVRRNCLKYNDVKVSIIQYMDKIFFVKEEKNHYRLLKFFFYFRASPAKLLWASEVSAILLSYKRKELAKAYQLL